MAAALSRAALFTLLALVATGSVLVLAVKLQYPDIGSGASPIEALSAAVIAGLGSLGIPIHLGGVTAAALPLGGLLFIGWSAVWAVSAQWKEWNADTPSRRVRSGLGLGVSLGVFSFILAISFRIRGTTPVSADLGQSLLFGGLWGSLFGALGALGSPRSLVLDAEGITPQLEAKEPGAGLGLRMATVFLGFFAFCGAVVLLAGMILRLLFGGDDFGFGDVFAGVIYFVFFGPNILIAVIALGSGSVISFGAEITQGGRQVGSVQNLSLFGWESGGPPLWAFLLPLLPLIATFLGGYQSRILIPRREEFHSALRWTAIFVGIAVFFWAALAEARLGAGLVGQRGFARLAANPPLTAVLAGGWTLLGGAVGWWAADRRATPSET